MSSCFFLACYFSTSNLPIKLRTWNSLLCNSHEQQKALALPLALKQASRIFLNKNKNKKTTSLLPAGQICANFLWIIETAPLTGVKFLRIVSKNLILIYHLTYHSINILKDLWKLNKASFQKCFWLFWIKLGFLKLFCVWTLNLHSNSNLTSNYIHFNFFPLLSGFKSFPLTTFWGAGNQVEIPQSPARTIWILVFLCLLWVMCHKLSLSWINDTDWAP